MLKEKNAWKSAAKFAAVTVPLGAAGGLLLWGVSQLRMGEETVHTYDENGEEHIYRIHRRPMVWLFAVLERIPFPSDLLRCHGKKNGS